MQPKQNQISVIRAAVAQKVQQGIAAVLIEKLKKYHAKNYFKLDCDCDYCKLKRLAVKSIYGGYCEASRMRRDAVIAVYRKRLNDLVKE